MSKDSCHNKEICDNNDRGLTRGPELVEEVEPTTPTQRHSSNNSENRISQAVFLLQCSPGLKCTICDKAFKNRSGLASHTTFCKRKSLTGGSPHRVNMSSPRSSLTVPPNGGTAPNPNSNTTGPHFGIGPNREIRLVHNDTQKSDGPVHRPVVIETIQSEKPKKNNLHAPSAENIPSETGGARASPVAINMNSPKFNMTTPATETLKDNLRSFPELSTENILGIMGFPEAENSMDVTMLTNIDISGENLANLERLVRKTRSLSKTRAQVARRVVSGLAHQLNVSCPRYYRIHPNLQLPDDPKNNTILENINQEALNLENKILQVVIDQNLEQLNRNTSDFNKLFKEEECAVSPKVLRNVVLTFMLSSTKSYLRFGSLEPDNRLRVTGLRKFALEENKPKKSAAARKVTTLKSFLKQCNALDSNSTTEAPNTKETPRNSKENTPASRTNVGKEGVSYGRGDIEDWKKAPEIIQKGGHFRTPRSGTRHQEGPTTRASERKTQSRKNTGRTHSPTKARESERLRGSTLHAYMSAYKVQKHWAKFNLLKDGFDTNFEVKRGLIGKPPLSLFSVNNSKLKGLLDSLSDKSVSDIGPIFVPLSKDLNDREFDSLRDKCRDMELSEFPTRCLIVRNFGGLCAVLPLLLRWGCLNKRFPNF